MSKEVKKYAFSPLLIETCLHWPIFARYCIELCARWHVDKRGRIVWPRYLSYGTPQLVDTFLWSYIRHLRKHPRIVLLTLVCRLGWDFCAFVKHIGPL